MRNAATIRELQPEPFIQERVRSRRVATAAGTGLAIAAAAAASIIGSSEQAHAAPVTIKALPTQTRPAAPIQAVVPATPAPLAPAPGVSYVVKVGDTVSHIAKRTGTTVSSIITANGLDSRARIRIGQILTIPSASSTATPKPAGGKTGTYTVKRGDTASAIAKRHGTTVSALIATNQLNAKAMIRIGQQLVIPGSTTTTTPEVGNTFAGRTYPQTTVSSANANKAALNAKAVPSKAEMRQMVANTARSMGVDPALALAIAHQESGFNMRSVSPANAVGVMQVIPSSGRWASDLVGRPLDLLSPQDNVTAGVAIIRQLLRTAPDEASAIAGYYQGLSSVKKKGMYADTRRYVANIQTLRASFR